MASYRPLKADGTEQTATAAVGDDHDPLLGQTLDDKLNSQGSAGLFSSISNLMNTILGTGMLAMPHAVAAGGIVPGALTICISGGLAAFGLYLLGLSARRAPHRQSSFFALSRLTYPKAAILFDAAIAIKCFGVAISYLIILGSLIPKVVVSFAADATRIPAVLVDRDFWIVMVVAILTPLTFLRRLHSLRFTSYIALIAVADLLLVVTYKCFNRAGMEPAGRVDVFHTSSALLSSLPVYIFAFTCAQNLHSVYNELIDNSTERINTVVAVSIGAAAGIYQLIGIMGYITFGSKVTANILDLYPHGTLVNTCRFAIVVLVLFSYPLQIHPCRASLDKVVSAFTSPLPLPKVEGLSYPSPDPIDDDEDEDEDEDASGHRSGPAVIPSLRFALLTIALLLSTTAVALTVTSLEAVLGVVGATGSTTISFLLPAAFFLKLHPARSHPSRGDAVRRAGARILLVVGAIVMVVCLGLNISEALHPHKVPGRGKHSHDKGPDTP